MKGLIRVLALSLYAAATLGGAGLHLLEFAPDAGCPGCAETDRGPSLFAQCERGPLPCHDPNHSHHTHPVHHDDGGCVTCSALAGQQAASTAPIAFAATEAAAILPVEASLPAPPAVHRPSDRAPPAL